MPSPADQLAEALAQTREMLSAAEAGDWEALARLQAAREPLIKTAFADPSALGEAERKLGEELLELNGQLTARANTARVDQGEASRQLVRGRRAVRAYNRHEP